jgi:outer membrane protein TolC
MEERVRPRARRGRTVPVAAGLALVLPAMSLASAAADVPSTGGRYDAPDPYAAAPVAEDTLRLTLDGAVRLAVERSPALRAARLDVREAAVRVREVRAETAPQLAATASYTREFASPNPFAGTDALGIFGAQAPTDWLLWNERARTDGDPQTEPIGLDEFRQRQEATYRDADVERRAGGDNPFAVENQFMAALSFEQVLWSPAALAELRAAEAEQAGTLAGARRQVLTIADTVRQAYLGALLAGERATVLARSVERTRAEAAEAARRVEQGVAPVPERLAVEVDLGNLRTDWIEARTQAGNAIDRLKLVLGLALSRPVVLVETLAVEDDYRAADTPLATFLVEAFARRDDVRQARLALQARRARAAAARAARRPAVNLFADVSVVGNVPDDRARVITDPLQPFQVEEVRRGFLSGDFWDMGANAGVRMQWNAFAGGRLRAQEQLAGVAVDAAQLQLEQARDRVEFEVRQALREVRGAAERARIQEENVVRAQRSYDMVAERVVQGVAVPLERRDASEQLDRSRLALAQARHDYIAARSRLRTAMGVGLGDALREEWLR